MIHFIYDTLFWLLLYFQDILRLLTLWFNHGATSEVQMALQKGFLHVKIEMWLAVLPQIIARIHSNNRIVRELIQSLLVRIGKGHPQVSLMTDCKVMYLIDIPSKLWYNEKLIVYSFLIEDLLTLEEDNLQDRE